MTVSERLEEGQRISREAIALICVAVEAGYVGRWALPGSDPESFVAIDLKRQMTRPGPA